MIYRKFFFVLFVAMVGIVMTACSSIVQIREHLLEKTPIGTKFDQVISFCASNNLKCYHSDTAGYLNQDTGKVVGVKSIWTGLSERKESPLTVTSISAYWGFDKDGKLIDIWVWKTIDAP
ncbi:hypothetical protein [Sulfuriferula thiophila]|uniref:hypothetical protein n=1 Tax=Sulfuriferula thiophila TaxID=1781211 RepID=UPI000F60A777|nr:hypothetical protein [Sulfuriferula thiophila]